MQRVYDVYVEHLFNHKRKSHKVDCMEYTTLVESKYRTLYRKGTWTALKTDPLSVFYVAPDEDPHNDDKSIGSRRCNWNQRNGGRGRGRGRGAGRVQCGGGRQTYHNCGKFGHLQVDCWQPGGGACDEEDEGDDAGDLNTFPGVNPKALHRPPRGPEPRERDILDSTKVKWCSVCKFCGSHFRAAHTTANVVAPDAGQPCEEIVEEEEEINEEEVAHPLSGLVAAKLSATGGGGAFARLRATSLL